MPTWPELVAAELEKQEHGHSPEPKPDALTVWLGGFERQVRFPHTCVGPDCAICRWVRVHPRNDA